MLKSFLRDESGATAIEYGLIGTLISIAIIVGATSLGSALNSKFFVPTGPKRILMKAVAFVLPSPGRE